MRRLFDVILILIGYVLGPVVGWIAAIVEWISEEMEE